MRRRGYTVRWPSGRAVMRFAVPRSRLRVGWHRAGDGRLVVSLGFLLVHWWGFR